MDNKVFTTVLLVVIVLLLGMSVLSKQNGGSELQQVLNQQTAMLQAQNRLELQMGKGGDTVELATALAKISLLESQLKGLEVKINQVAQVAQAAKNAAPAAPAAQAQRPPQVDPNKVHNIPVAHTPVIGPKTAKVTITEFVDFECPFCARFHPPISAALKAYPNDVNYVIKNFPLNFHPNARKAAKVALAAAEQGKYQPMVDKLLENGKSLGDATFKRLAQEIGLDVNKFEADLRTNDAKYEGYIQKDMQLASQVGVRGTPTFYINGKQTTARTFEALQTEINGILGR